MSTGFTFGSKTTAPAFGQTGFGTQTPGSITFGTPAVQQNPTPFGASQPSTGFGSTNFGTPAFGTPASTTQSTGFAFGAPATSSTGFSFGATPASSAPSSGLTFGATISSAPTANTTFGFGTPAQPSTGLTFGATATTSTTGFGFGSAAPAATGLFSTPASTATPSFGFATPSTQPSLNLGQTQTTTTSGLFSTPTFPFGTATTTSAPSLNFGFTAATGSAAPTFSLTTPSTTTTTGLSFSLTTTATQPSGLSFGLGGTTPALSFTKPATTTTATSSQPTLGLGGIVQSTPKTGVSSPSKPDILPRDQQLPNEFLQLVDAFKNLTKQQKSFSSDVARSSAKEFKKVAVEIDQIGSSLNDAEKQLQNNRAVAEKLKIDTAKGLQNIEMAQRTMDTPPGLQYDNTMPMAFFKELVDNFEKEMQNLKLQIEYTDKYVRNFDRPIPLNSQDLALGMRRLHETFVALAGRLQTVHAQVEFQKDQYLNFRKFMLNDDTNIFETPKQQTDILAFALNNFNYKPPTVASGPSPFSSLSHPSVIQAAVQNQTQTTNVTTPTTGSIAFGITTQPVTSGTQSLFGNVSLGSTFGQTSSLSFNSSSNNFQLQKPPSGNKRGKSIL